MPIEYLHSGASALARRALDTETSNPITTAARPIAGTEPRQRRFVMSISSRP
jgi:hypothetical protein